MEKYSAVIIEPRKHDLFKVVLKNFLKNLHERWDILIFHGHNNEIFLNELIEENFINDKKRIKLIKLNIHKNISDKQYSYLLTNKKFYDYIPTEMFLIFQTDTLLSDVYNYKIYDFMEYDYVGAPWINYGSVGNGGLSLRKKSKMIEIIENNPYLDYCNEDAYFCNAKTNINKPSYEKAMEFAVETSYYDKPFGIHKAYCYTNLNQLHELAKHIPDIYELYEYYYLHKKWDKPDTIIHINDFFICQP